MKLETFFEKFDQLAEAPNAVAKMRELILDFAAQGLLTQRMPIDGQASDIVEAIATERAQRTAKKSIRKQAVLPDLDLDNLPFNVPPTWTWVRLGNCVPSYTDDFVDGPFGSNLKADEYTEHGVPIVRLKNIGRHQFKTKEIKFVSQKKAEELKRHSFKPGDLLLNKLGEPVGKCCIAPEELGAGIIVADVIRLRLSNELFAPRLVSLIINSPTIARQLLSQITGITRDRVSLEKLRNLAIPLPPLAEQNRIVAKVDELMALCDRLEAQQQERETRHAALARASLARFADAPTPANLQFLFHPSYAIPPADLRKSILTLAVQGKLVPQDPNDEPAEDLFARIENTKETLIKQRAIKRVTFEANPCGDACGSLPPGWLCTRLGKLFDVRDGTHDTPKYVTEGFPLITSKNIHSGSLLFDGAKLISETDHRQISERSRVDRGDILFAMIGSIGNPVIVNTDREFSIKNVALFKYYTAADSEPRFLLLYLKLVAEEMKAQAAGGVQSFVSLGFLRNYLFPLPPLVEQRRIVAKVEQLMALVDELETQLATARATGADLMEAVVAELTAAA